MNDLKKLYERYLNLIGIETIPIGYVGLAEIVRNHITHIPFENILKIELNENYVLVHHHNKSFHSPSLSQLIICCQSLAQSLQCSMLQGFDSAHRLID